MKRTFMVAVLLATFLGLTACGAGTPTEPNLPEIVVNPNRISVEVGQTTPFAVTGGNGAYVVEVLTREGSSELYLPFFSKQVKQVGTNEFALTAVPEMRQYSSLVLRVRSGAGEWLIYHYRDVSVYVR